MNTIALWAPHWGVGAGFSPIFPIVWGLLWVALIAAAVTGWRRGWWGPRHGHTPSPSATSPTASAEQILAERYARGEMTDDEYFEKVSVLRGGSA